MCRLQYVTRFDAILTVEDLLGYIYIYMYIYIYIHTHICIYVYICRLQNVTRLDAILTVEDLLGDKKVSGVAPAAVSLCMYA